MIWSGRQKPEREGLLPDCYGLWGGEEIPYSINHSIKAGLYTSYEYTEFVPIVPIRWAELATL